MSELDLPTPAQRLGFWRQWFERCDLGLCDREASSYMAEFAAKRFVAAVARVEPQMVPDANVSLDGRPGGWHYLENYLRAGVRMDGKGYKRHLAEGLRSTHDHAADDIESYAASCLRTVARQFVCTDADRRQIASLQQMLDSESGLTLEEILPDPATEADNPAIAAAYAELQQIARALAPELMAKLSEREQQILRAHALGLPLYAPEVLQAAGLEKSQAYTVRSQAVSKLADHLNAKYVGEEADALAELTVLALREVMERCAQKNFPPAPEKSREPRFMK